MTNSAKPSFIGIGEMSRQTGVGIETIRYFEKIGMMPAPGRSEGGNRQYTNDHLFLSIDADRSDSVRMKSTPCYPWSTPRTSPAPKYTALLWSTLAT